MSDLDKEISKLRETHRGTSQIEDKDKLYDDLLQEYKKAKARIVELEHELEESKTKLPSKDEVETMSSMIDLIGKLDESTIEKLSKFGAK
jgi:hypothetical protein